MLPPICQSQSVTLTNILFQFLFRPRNKQLTDICRASPEGPGMGKRHQYRCGFRTGAGT